MDIAIYRLFSCHVEHTIRFKNDKWVTSLKVLEPQLCDDRPSDF